MSFDLFNPNIQPFKISIEPPVKKYFVSIKVLGLRGLQSLGVLAIKRPFVKFDVGSIITNRDKVEMGKDRMIELQPAESGSSPNFR